MKTIICTDSLLWLPQNPNQGAFITSLPEAAELGMDDDIPGYAAWFTAAARLCFQAASPECPVVFCQTDRRYAGRWLSKSHILQNVAADLGFFLSWHKIELRVFEPGAVDIRRPGYRHLLAFGTGGAVYPGPKADGVPTTDVIPASPTLYTGGFGILAARLAVQYCLQFTNKVIDPFCGRGTVPAAVHEAGGDAIGIDIDKKQCLRAEQLMFLPPCFTRKTQ